MRDRLLLTPARIKEMAHGVREVAALRRSDWRNAGGVDATQRPAHPQSARAAGSGRNYL